MLMIHGASTAAGMDRVRGDAERARFHGHGLGETDQPPLEDIVTTEGAPLEYSAAGQMRNERPEAFGSALENAYKCRK
jgi:hypothetical protein